MTSAKPGKKHKGDKGDKLKKKLVAPPPAGKPGIKPVAPAAEKAGKPKGPEAAGKPAPAGKPGAPGGPPGKPGRKERKGRRRELDFPEGELVLPGGPQTPEEVLYVLRGAVCAERPAGEHAVEEILTKRNALENQQARGELLKMLEPVKKRFETVIEPMLPSRAAGGGRRTFQSVMERARYRRREMGAFMRGLDLGRTEMGHMDPHGEDSLHELMKWAARLENLLESEEPEKADYAQFHRGLDQLENTTEALIIDVEQTLRRLRDRNRTQ
jgi:hypothetical protein